MKPKNQKNLVWCDDFDNLIHTLNEWGDLCGPAEMCEILRCSRGWFDKHVADLVPHVYLSRGYRTDGQEIEREGTDWLFLLQGRRPQLDVPQSSYIYPKSQFLDLVERHLLVERRTVVVDLLSYIPPAEIDGLERIWSGLDERVSEIERERDSHIADLGPDESRGAWEAWARAAIGDVETEAVERYLERRGGLLDERGSALLAARLGPAGRGKVAWREVGETWSSLGCPPLQTVADMTDWGEYPESVYRKIHMSGMLRLTLELPDADGVVSEKVYYAHPATRVERATGRTMRPSDIAVVPWDVWADVH